VDFPGLRIVELLAVCVVVVHSYLADSPKNLGNSDSLDQQDSMQLITASVDTRIRIFELSQTKNNPVAVLEAHTSVPRGLDISADGRWLLSGGRDSVVLVWDLLPLRSGKSSIGSSKKGKDRINIPILVQTIPVLERVEFLAILRSDEESTSSSTNIKSLRFFTGGESGLVKVWQVKESNTIFTLGNDRSRISDDSEEQRQIVHGM
jgi:U3 small nucleolar RNA-associated protein 13